MILVWWNLQRLKSGSDKRRRRAIKSLSKSDDPRALLALVKALGDKSYLVRKEAARVLGEIGDAGAVVPLIQLIDESFHYAIARTAVGALESVLVRAADAVIPEDMEAASVLGDVNGIDYELMEGIAWFSETRNARPWIIDCSRVRTLAFRELTRRGLIN